MGFFAVTGIDPGTGKRSRAYINPAWIAVIEPADETIPFDAATTLTLAPTLAVLLVDDHIDDVVHAARLAASEVYR